LTQKGTHAVNKNALILIAGSDTLLGASMRRCWRQAGYRHVVGDRECGVRADRLDEVNSWIETWRPQYLVHAAGRSAGIGANQAEPAALCHHNLATHLALFDAARRAGVQRLLYIASSCCYPRDAPQPLQPQCLWSGPLEPTSQAYAAAKLLGIELCRAYRSQYELDCITVIPANVFGREDDFDSERGHVIPSLLVRMHCASQLGHDEVCIQGTGQARRDFVFADDVAEACLMLLGHPAPPEIINVGSGRGTSIAELAGQIALVTGFRGRLAFQAGRPEGAPEKILDVEPAKQMGWCARTPLFEALMQCYDEYRTRTACSEPIHA
jgi:GDP-L-fucose synthase